MCYLWDIIGMVRTTIFCIIFFVIQVAQSAQLLIPMDESQKNHLKSYGLAFWLLKQNQEVQWLLNYQGGSFMFNYSAAAEKECKVRGITYETITDGAANAIITEIQNPSANMNVVKLLNAPKIAVYSPKTKQPWDDAVTLVLTYAEIPYDIVFDDEVLGGKLLEYDWLHLHHEDFTGQFGKFYSSYHSAPWYVAEVEEAEAMAKKHGFGSARELKRAVVFKIRDFMLGGGFLFAMCSATDTYDIAMAAAETDICESMFDGTPADGSAQEKLDYEKCIAFKDFTLIEDPMYYEFSNIDVDPVQRRVREEEDLFTLFDYSAKWDLIPAYCVKTTPAPSKDSWDKPRPTGTRWFDPMFWSWAKMRCSTKPDTSMENLAKALGRFSAGTTQKTTNILWGSRQRI